MNSERSPIERRLGAALAAAVFVGATILSVTPVVPIVIAIDPTPDPSASPTSSPSPGPSPSDPTPTPSTDPGTSPDPSASPDPSPSPSPDPTPSPDPSIGPTPSPSSEPSPSPSPSLPDSLVPVTLVDWTADSSAPRKGRHRIDPGSPLTLTVTAVPDGDVAGGALVLSMPSGWAVLDAAGGEAGAGAIRWTNLAAAAGSSIERTIILQAPSIDPSAGPVTATFAWALETTASTVAPEPVASPQASGEPQASGDPQPPAGVQASGNFAGPSLSVLVAPRLLIASATLAQITVPGEEPTYLAPGEPITSEPLYDIFRIRFLVSNPDLVAIDWAPVLEYADAGSMPVAPVPIETGMVFAPVPIEAEAGLLPFYVTREWIKAPATPPGQAPSSDGSIGTGPGSLGPDGLGLAGVDASPAVPTTQDDPAYASPPGWAGTIQGPEQAVLPVGSPAPAAGLTPAEAIDAADAAGAARSGTPVEGLRSMGINPMPAMALPPDGYAQIEFSVRATGDASYLGQYRFRLTDAGSAFTPAAEGLVTIEAQPPLTLSPGQQAGIDVPDAPDAVPPTQPTISTELPPDVVYLQPEVAYALLGPGAEPGLLPAGTISGPAAVASPVVAPSPPQPTTPEAAPAPEATDGLLYPLAPLAPEASLIGPPPVGGKVPSPHVPDTSLTSDACAFCHRAHSGQATAILSAATPQSTLCFTCHDGVGSTLNVKSQYINPSPTIPPNDPATRSYFSHDALQTPSPHALASNDEFGGRLNRHSACADCHNSHNSTATDSTQTTTGWTVSGRQAAVSGVKVTNGAAGSAPTYAFLDGAAGSQPTREYEVCFKCHSGYTQLLDNAGPPPQPPSRQMLDKGVELNPANLSYHPIEAAGTNATTAMANSLTGTSPYKQWNFTTSSTIRCVNCHGDPRKYSSTAPPNGVPPTPAAGSALATHTSQYRGILMQGYENRVLKPGSGTGSAYAAADFALCFMCHAEEPFTNQSSSATNFRRHEEHMTGLAGKGEGARDIDRDGDGQGNALCAECHFRIHSTTYAVDGQTPNPRLVNFSPNVQPYRDTLEWTANPGGGGTCTLVCHGKDHQQRSY